MPDTHLIFPLIASLMFVCGMLASKRLSQHHVSPLTILAATNFGLALVFVPFWVLGGPPVEPWMLWRPLVVAVLSMLGMGFTFAAIHVGDVSVATPMFGLKAVLVAVLLAIVGRQPPTVVIWVAATLATIGVVTVQWTDFGEPKKTLRTILLASGAATSYAGFDVSLQHWSPMLSPGRMLPLAYIWLAILTIPLAIHAPWPQLRARRTWGLLGLATFLVSVQAIGVAGTLSIVGDAARVNIVYALRGLWGVLLAWFLANRIGGAEAKLGGRTMGQRLIGASLLTVAVMLAVWQ